LHEGSFIKTVVGETKTGQTIASGGCDLDLVQALIKIFLVVFDDFHAHVHSCVRINALESGTEDSFPYAILYLEQQSKGMRVNIAVLLNHQPRRRTWYRPAIIVPALA
jgi:hypothetical protein